MVRDLTEIPLTQAEADALYAAIIHTHTLSDITDAGTAAGVDVADMAGIGLSESSNALNLDISGLTEDTSPDMAADYLASFDTSSGETRKIKLQNFGFGVVKQVVSTTKTDTFSTASTSWTPITGLSVSITLTSATSRVLILGILNWGGYHGYGYFFVPTRDGSIVAIGDTDGNATPTFVGGYAVTNRGTKTAPVIVMDSPRSVGPHTYDIQMKVASSSYPGYVNRTYDDYNYYEGRGVSTLILVEIE